MRKFILPFLLLVIGKVLAQDSIGITGYFVQTPFVEFVSLVESQSNYRFYFEEDSVEDVKISTSGNRNHLDSILRVNLGASGLNFYIGAQNSVFIFRGEPIIDEQQNIGVTGFNEHEETNLTEAEKNYIKSRQVRSEQMYITLGDQRNAIAGATRIVRGRVIENETGEPVVGATIYVEETKRGAITDLDGYFNLALKTGNYHLKVNYVSMVEQKINLNAYSDGNLNITLQKELVSLKEVKIMANRFSNVKGMQMGYEHLTAKTMKQVPVVMGEKDLLKIAQMLPGVQSSGEGSAGLIVRGGTADQNLFYINKLPVYNTSHLFGFFTAFSPDVVNDFSLYKSNLPAKYGGRISSVFDITTRQGSKKKIFAQGGISPVTGHVSFEAPIVKDKSSVVVSYRTTYSDWILKRVNDEDIRNSSASFYDLTVNYNSKINDNNIIKIFGYNSSDAFSLSTTNDYDYANLGGTVNLKHFYSTRLSSDMTAVYSRYNFGNTNKANPSEAYRHEYVLQHNELKLDFLYLSSKNHRLSFGGGSILYQLNRGEVDPWGQESVRTPVDLGTEKGLESSLYVSDEFSLSSHLNITAGLRMSHYGYLGPQTINEYIPGSPLDVNNIRGELEFGNNEVIKSYFSVEPRIALNYALTAQSSIKLAYNRAAQNIFMLSNTTAISPTDQWKLADYYLTPPISNQLSLGYYFNVPERGLEASAEVYGKQTRNVVEYKDGVSFVSDQPTEMLLLQGKQDAYGLELMARKKTGKFTGWISYTYSRSFVLVDSPIATEQINYGNVYPSNYDIPHSINLVSNYQTNRRLSFSTNMVYSTGRPITYPVAAYESGGKEFIAYSERNQYRIPDYFRMDFSINLEGNLNRKKFIHSYWMLNVYNLTGRKNAYSVYFESNNGHYQGYKLSIFGQPIVTLSWNFKLGNYANE